MKRQNARSLLLVASMIIYLLIGAAIFEALESTNEEREREKLEREKVELMKKYNLTENDWDLLSDHMIRFIPHKAGLQWKFAGAIYFSTTVITTIGYGHCTPKTNWGKIVCMMYALVGIPLNLVTFQSVGERLNTFTTFLLCTIRRRIKPSHKAAPDTNQAHNSRRQNRFDGKYSQFQKKKHTRSEGSCPDGFLRSKEPNFPVPEWNPYNQLNTLPSVNGPLTSKNESEDNQTSNSILSRAKDLRTRLRTMKISSNMLGDKNNAWSLNEMLSSSLASNAGEATDTHLICVTTSISTVFVAGGAYAFSRFEGWNYLDSLYFCIITLTTVGFGDLVALQNDKVLQDRPGYVTFNIFFILSGLAVVSAAMNLLVLRFLTMNTEDEKRDKMLESFNAEAKVLNVFPYWLTSAQESMRGKKLRTLAGLFDKIRRRFVSAKSPPPFLKPPRYRVTRAPTENVHHLIDVGPAPNAPRTDMTHHCIWRKAKCDTCLCRSKLVTV